ncbi:host attachment protein [Phaeovulum sp.]|uniref:baeRF12 domain-containing protein n=1 Tax=Phaeovulum sp. TaxID=2934796 RepID=UPI0039E4DAB7
MLLSKGTWVVVADGEKALVLENTGPLTKTTLRVLRRDEADLEIPGADTDRPGRRADPGPGQMSAMEIPDYARLASERFAASLVARLVRSADRGKFAHLVLVAPPQVLGALRDEMDTALRARVVAELPKTLTNHPVPKMAELIAAEIDKL